MADVAAHLRANCARLSSRSMVTTFSKCCERTAALMPVSVPRSHATEWLPDQLELLRAARKSRV